MSVSWRGSCLVAAALVAAAAAAHAQVRQPRCAFPRDAGPIAFVSAHNVEEPGLAVSRLREALARRQVVPPAIDLLLVDESDSGKVAAQVAVLPLERRAAVVTLSGHVAKALSQRRLAAPTVFATIVDPVDWGIVEAAGARRANVTGITYDVELEWKYLEHLRVAFPAVRRVGILADRHFFDKRVVQAMMAQAGERLGVAPEAFVATSREELEAAFADPRAAAVDAWIVPETPVVFRHEARVLELVGRRRVPSIFGHRSLLAKGATMVFGVEFGGMHDELASILRMLCEGTRARDIPVARPHQMFLGVSLANAKVKGLAVDPRILTRATIVE
jgi:ABC-type uncharacterized transport system substrate-binding protein